MNFRFAYNTTLARPELRERTNVFEFDAFQMGLVIGNPQLVNQHTRNLDFRWEWFPHPGEVLAFSTFGKQINNQLVRVFDLRTEGLNAKFPEYPTIQYQNDLNTGYVWGIEMEAVKNLGNDLAIAEQSFRGREPYAGAEPDQKIGGTLPGQSLIGQEHAGKQPAV